MVMAAFRHPQTLYPAGLGECLVRSPTSPLPAHERAAST